MAHTLGIIGLSFNTFGALLLLRFPPGTLAVTADGAATLSFTANPTPAGRRRYTRQQIGFYIAIVALAAGFILQLIDLLRS
jgi:hypothetical protein